MKLGALDLETHAIQARPHYPPEPVGVALRSEGQRRGTYLAWGHPSGNNTTKAAAVKHIKQFLRDHLVVCHHAGFDLDVLETRLGIAWPAEHHDTLLLAFLLDPDSKSLSLKPLAERYLGQAPTEQDALHRWILEHVPEATPKTAGAHIAKAPGDVVAPYAIGDVDRTLKLFKKFYSEVKGTKLQGAYDRERRVTRSLIKMERRGIPIRTRALEKAVKHYEGYLLIVETQLCQRLKVAWSPDLAWSGKNFAEQLVRSKLVEALPTTEKGNPSTSAESLATAMDPKLAHEFEVRSQIATCLNTFMRPWLAQARETGGLMFARFNQVRNGETGARTGRLSMTPNLQNVIRSDKDARVPRLRDYIGTGVFAALGQRDYSQQELRLLAHFEDGPLLAAYKAEPERDGHELVRELIAATTSIQLERRPVKDLNFGLIYGQGLNLTAEKMGVTKEEAKRLRDAHAASLPGIPALQKQLRKRVAADEPIWTWGGRRYYCEPPAFINGQRRTFEYKMLNKLIQGSAADVTKQAMVNYDALPMADENPMLLQVHDELIFGIRDYKWAKEVHEAMRAAMADVPGIEVPMRSDGKLGRVSWGQMGKYGAKTRVKKDTQGSRADGRGGGARSARLLSRLGAV